MGEKIAFHLRGVALLTWATVLLGFFLSGRLPSYLHPTFRPLVPIAGVVLLLLAILYWWLSRANDEHSGHDHDHGFCGHSHGLSVGTVLAFLILVVPVVMAKLVSPGEFSATAIQNRWAMMSNEAPMASYERQIAPLPGEEVGEGGDFSMAAYLERNEAGQIKAEVIDLMFGIEDDVIRKDFSGQPVAVVGQYMPAMPGDGSNRFRLARMFMWCCAADSRPISIVVEGSTDVSPGAWVRVVGTASFPEQDGQRVALVVADQIEPTETPREALLY